MQNELNEINWKWNRIKSKLSLYQFKLVINKIGYSIKRILSNLHKNGCRLTQISCINFYGLIKTNRIHIWINWNEYKFVWFKNKSYASKWVINHLNWIVRVESWLKAIEISVETLHMCLWKYKMLNKWRLFQNFSKFENYIEKKLSNKTIANWKLK